MSSLFQSYSNSGYIMRKFSVYVIGNLYDNPQLFENKASK